jgi:predicted TIM-barrel fold metal-dependent hydrolase
MRDETPPGAGYRATESRPYTPLADHLFHHLVQLAEAHGVPMQIHTGLHAGNGNFVAHSRPADLTNLFFRYPRVTFDLFHVGYPYHHEATVLAKTFRNVCLDFCWMHIVSPLVAQRMIDEALDLVPSNKIFGFGGDYRYPELSYAHLVMARRNIAAALAARVRRGDLRQDGAVAIARALLHDNPARVFTRLAPDARA